MADSYYECHVTIKPGDNKSSPIDLIETRGWRFSAIDGDIVEGAGVKYYATCRFHSSLPVEAIMERLFAMAGLLSLCGYDVTRRKIEHVIYDDRSSKICPPNCLECILPTE